MSFITGVGLTSYGKDEGSSSRPFAGRLVPFFAKKM